MLIRPAWQEWDLQLRCTPASGRLPLGVMQVYPSSMLPHAHEDPAAYHHCHMLAC